MTKFNVNVLDVMVTEWNSEYQDWSGEEFLKEGFHIGNAKSNKLDDVLATVNTMFDIDKKDVEVNEDGQLIFTVTEDENAMQDDDGHYLVCYIVGVEKVETVAIEN
ncbi:hypothetical protein phiSA039_0215 [Staphylococcus phage phiSA039]|nr:hypothetical protein METROID_16 [Staphylococcus phage Metroid]QKE56295.1 hypothetical protein METROID_248 [Staphylococcus phage Metroid]QKV30554.1 hypothetical protein [Staphylococcus phage ESa1]QKV30781.1 hypothetical protein [Staphylococcus phage ESa1]BBC69674.1 hypothetical protein phiSA039_0215 [Staphylococcus phage phiSA039]